MKHENYIRTKLFVMIVLLLLSPLSTSVFAADHVYLSQSINVFNVIQATYDYSFSMTVENTGTQTYSGITAVVGKLKGFESAEFIPGSETVGPKENKTYFFKIDIGKDTDPGVYNLPITFYHIKDGTKEELIKGGAVFNVSRHISSVAGYDAALLDMAYKLDDKEGFTAGEINVLTILVTNRGNSIVQDVKVSLTLPEGMTLNNSVAAQSAGSLGIGIERTVRFPILLDKKIENKNHAITVNIAGTSKKGAVSSDQTIYVPVRGGEKEEKEEDSIINMEISDISVPDQITAGDDIVLAFSVKNTGPKEVENVKIEAVPEAGLANRSRNVFVENKMASGEKKAYYVFFISDIGAGGKSVPIKIAVTAGKNENAVTLNQYASVYMEKQVTEAGITFKTPQLIVDDYSYGGSRVLAGTQFNLNISFRNTSPKNITNAKISLNAEGGAFIPVGSSNSLYISEIGAGDRVTRTLVMSASPTAEQKTTAINIDMTYEDDDGGQFSSSDVISIPVEQITKLTIDDIIGPPVLYAGEYSGLDVRFYNTGKTILQNLRVIAEGNFDLMDNAVYYAGNMNSGASDSYSFAFLPREPGELRGLVVFTFDDPSGDPQREEKEFSFNVTQYDEGMYMDMPYDIPPLPSFKKYYIGGGILAAFIIGLIILVRVLKRRKMHRDMEIDLLH